MIDHQNEPHCASANENANPHTTAAPAIPPELERAAAEAGASLRSQFQFALSRPKAPEAAARAFIRALRGPRAKVGRKGYPNTTEALRLLKGGELRYIPRKKRWAIIYKRVIPGYGEMLPEQRSGAAGLLRDRVHARLRSRKRRARASSEAVELMERDECVT